MERLRLADTERAAAHELAQQNLALAAEAAAASEVVPVPLLKGLAASPPTDAVAALRANGIVRLTGGLPPEACDALQRGIGAALDVAVADGRAGRGRAGGFGLVRGRKARWDMYVEDRSTYLTRPLRVQRVLFLAF